MSPALHARAARRDTLVRRTRATVTFAVVAVATWYANGGSSLAPAQHGAPVAPQQNSRSVVPAAHRPAPPPALTGDSAARPVELRNTAPAVPRPSLPRAHPRRRGHGQRQARLRQRFDPHTLARSERSPRRAREHNAPSPPSAPAQAGLHRHGPDSRGGGFTLPVSPAATALAARAIERGAEGRLVANGERAVHGGRAPPAMAGRHDAPARPTPAPHAARSGPACNAAPALTALNTLRSPRAARSLAAGARLSPKPRGFRVAGPGGGPSAPPLPSMGEPVS